MPFFSRVFRLSLVAALLVPSLAIARVCPFNCTGCAQIEPENEFNYVLLNGTGEGWLGFIPETGSTPWGLAADITLGWSARTAGAMSGFSETPPRICGESSSKAYVEVIHDGPADSCNVTFEIDWLESEFRTLGSGASGAYGGMPQSGQLIRDEVVGLNPLFRLRTAAYTVQVSQAQPNIELFALASGTRIQLVPLPIGLHVYRALVYVALPRQTGGFDCGQVRISDRHASPFPPSRGFGPSITPVELVDGFAVSGIAGGRIHGTVRAAASFLPIIYGGVELLDGTGQLIESQPIPMGEFAFDGLEPGSYYVRTVDTEFLNQEAGGVECETIDCVLNSGTPIVIADGSNETVSFVLGGAGPLFRNSFEEYDFVNWHRDHLDAP